MSSSQPDHQKTRKPRRPLSKRNRLLKFEALEGRRLLAADWRNPVDALDPSSDGYLTPIDALLVINYLNAARDAELPDTKPEIEAYIDVNGDNFASPLDALFVINQLNQNSRPFRILSEGNSIVSETEITIGIGQLEGIRKYRLELDAQFDTSDSTSPVEDTIAVYLVSSDDPSQTLIDRNTPGTSLFSLAGNRAELIPGIINWDGQVLEIDTTQVNDRDTAILKVQLIRGDHDSGTRLSIRPLSNLVDTKRTSQGAFLTRQTAALPGTSLNLASLSVQDAVVPELSNIRFDTTTKQYTAELTLTNLGVGLTRNLAVEFPNLPVGVTLQNASGSTGAGIPYLNVSPGIGRGGLRHGMVSQRVVVTFDNPTGIPFVIDPIIRGSLNHSPTLAAIPTQTLSPGGVASIALSASDADGDLVTYALKTDTPLPNVRLDADGTLVVRPSPDQIGQYQFSVVASDGDATAETAVQVNVVADTNTSTRVSGRVLNIDGTPIANLRVEIGSVQGLTKADGSFLLNLGTAPVPSDTLRIRGDLFTGGQGNYPFIAEKFALLLEHDLYSTFNNVIDRPIYLPTIDPTDGGAIDPNQTIVITSQSVPDASVTVAANTLLNQQGTAFTGTLTMTEVPTALTPAALPPGLLPDLVVTIQPGEMNFSVPAPLTLPNRGGYAPGTIMDLWSINPATGEFDNVGQGQVSGDGSVIDTIDGGIRNSSWHLFVPPPEVAREVGQEIGNQLDRCQKAESCVYSNSQVELHSGALRERHNLVTYQSQGIARGLTLFYDSQRADPRPIINFGLDNANGTNTNRYLVARLSFSNGGSAVVTPGFAGGMGLTGGEHFWKLPDGINDITTALQGDLRSLPSGIYSFTLTQGVLTKSDDEKFVGALSDSTGTVVSINESQSSLGAGWNIDGVQRLIESDSGSLLLVDGDGTNIVFEPQTDKPGSYDSPAGDFSTLVKNTDGSYTRTTSEKTVVRFDSLGRLVSITDRNDNVTRYIYAGSQLSKIVDPVGLETSLRYDSNGRVFEIVDPAGRKTQLAYDTAGNLIRVTDPDGSTRTWGYDADHHMTTEVDQNGAFEQTLYDFAGRAIHSIRKDGTELDFSTIQTKYLFPSDLTSDPLMAPIARIKSDDSLAQTIDAAGNVTSTQLDQAGQAIQSTDAIGSLAKLTRNQNNLVTSVTDPRGLQTSLTYDSNGNLVRAMDQIVRDEAISPVFAGELYRINGNGKFLTADMDGDGHIDVVYQDDSETMPQIGILYGKGDGSFESAVQIESDLGLLAVDDFDGDGIVDILTYSALLTGVGERIFSQDDSFAVSITGQYVDSVDVNNDGRSDLVTTVFSSGSNYKTQVWLNQTTGMQLGASLDTPYTAGAAYSVHVADFNNDSNADIITNRDLYLGNGDGNFSSIVVDNLPSWSSIPVIADFDVDANLDIAAISFNATDRKFSLMLSYGNGDGSFAGSIATPIQAFGSLTALDLNQDGFLDLITGRETLLGGADQTWDKISDFGINDETKLVDLNHNQKPDLLVSYATGYLYTLLDVGASSLLDYTTRELSELSSGDFNNDGNPDIVGTNSGVNTLSFAIGDGKGDFTKSDRALPFHPTGLAVDDLNHDGFDDILLIDASGTEGSLVLIGYGSTTGAYQFDTSISLPFRTSKLLVTDIDGQGDRDIVAYGTGSNHVILVSSSSPNTYSVQELFEFSSAPKFVSAFDVNLDGLNDIVVAESSQVSVLLQQASVGFNDPVKTLLAAPDQFQNWISGDFNGDRSGDLAYLSSSSRLILAFGRVDGSFRLQVDDYIDGQFFNFYSSNALRTEDFDRDGITDLIYSGVLQLGPGSESPYLGFRRGNGDGSFRDPERYGMPVYQPDVSVIADFNNDGETDLAGSRLIAYLHTQRGRDQAFVPKQLFDDTFNLLSETIDGLGHQALFKRDPNNGNQLSATKVVGEIDSALNRETDDLVTLYTYTARGLVETVTDPLGQVTQYGYDQYSRLVSQTLAKGTSHEAITRYEYDTAGNRTAIIDSNGNRSIFQYDSMNRVVRTIEADPDGNGPLASPETTFAYDHRGNLVETTDALLRKTTFVFDHRDRLIETVYPDGTKEFAQYDRNGNLMKAIDAKGNTSGSAFDARNRLASTTDSGGNTTSIAYDLNNNPATVTDALGRVSKTTYDARNRVTRQVSALGEVTSTKYDVLDNVISIDDRGVVTRFEYDELNRMTARIDADPDGDGPLPSPRTEYRYDKASNLIEQIDPLGRSTRYQYDALNRLIKTIDANGGETRFEYDRNSNQTAIIDPVGNRTAYVYDSLNRVIKETDPAGAITLFAYDAVGNLIRQTDRNGRVVSFTYDTMDRVLTETWQGDTNVVRYSYDAIGNVTRINDTFSSLTYTYDSLNRVSSVTDSTGTVLRYSYDAVGNTTSVTDTPSASLYGSIASTTTSYAYDKLNRTNSITQSGPDTSNKRVDFEYSSNGLLTGIKRFASLDTSQLVAQSTWSFDALRRLESIAHLKANGQSLLSYSFDFDAASQLVQKTTNTDVVDYAYDDISQLTGANYSNAAATDETYSFDANGNRTATNVSQNWRSGPANRLVTDGVHTYTYDAEGNMTSRTEIASGAKRELTWDYRNRLTRVTDKNGSGTLVQVTRFEYDALNRRIRQFADSTPSDAVDAAITQFVYDREDILLEVVDSDGSGPTAPVLADRYFHGPGIDQVIARQSAGKTEWYLTDQLGSTTMIVDSNGVAVATADYDSFGNIVNSTGNVGRYTFTGRELDATTGLYYYRARYYDATLGKFVNEDPIGFSAGDVNSTRYVFNSPLTHVDFSGFESGTISLLSSPGNEDFKQQYWSQSRAPKITPGQAAGIVAGTVFAVVAVELLPAEILAGAGFLVVEGVVGFASGGVASATQQQIDNGTICLNQLLADASESAAVSIAFAGIIRALPVKTPPSTSMELTPPSTSIEFTSSRRAIVTETHIGTTRSEVMANLEQAGYIPNLRNAEKGVYEFRSPYHNDKYVVRPDQKGVDTLDYYPPPGDGRATIKMRLAD